MSASLQKDTAIKFVARLSSAGNSRKIISVPAGDLEKVADLTGKPILVTLTPII